MTLDVAIEVLHARNVDAQRTRRTRHVIAQIEARKSRSGRGGHDIANGMVSCSERGGHNRRSVVAECCRAVGAGSAAGAE